MVLTLGLYIALSLLVIITITYTSIRLKRIKFLSALVLISYYVIRAMLLGAYFSLFDHHHFYFLEVNDTLLVDVISLSGMVVLIFLPLPSRKEHEFRGHNT